VDIADDLDAPDLAEGAKPDAAHKRGAADADSVAAPSQPAAPADLRPPATSAARRAEKLAPPARTILAPDQSAELRERLLVDIGQLQSADKAADWVHKNLVAKNALIVADADAVEAAFRDRLAAIELALASGQGDTLTAPTGESASPVEKLSLTSIDHVAPDPIITPSRSGVRRRRVAAKTIRLRDKEHCKFVASQPCIVCGRVPTEAHHIRFAQPRAFGRKVSDEYTVPVCRVHHHALHGYGDEASWWAGVGIDPLPIALELWRRSRLTYSLAATWSEPLSDAIPLPAAKVERPLDNHAGDGDRRD
jgi:hypothetical protein